MAGPNVVTAAPSPLLLRQCARAAAPHASAGLRGQRITSQRALRRTARAQVRAERSTGEGRTQGKVPERAEAQAPLEAPSVGVSDSVSGGGGRGASRRALLIGASGLALAAAAGPAIADADADVTAEAAETVATTADESVAELSSSAGLGDGAATGEAGAEADQPALAEDAEPQAPSAQAEAVEPAPEAAAEGVSAGQDPEPAAAIEPVPEQPSATEPVPEPAPAPAAAEQAPTPAAAPEAAPKALSLEEEVQRRQQELYLQKQALDDARLLEQNRRMQSLNGAPDNFPAFVRDGFNVRVVAGPEYVRTPSGLIYWDIVPGNGDAPKSGQQVEFHYTGYNESGRRIDSSYTQGRPAQSRMGINAMIPGFEEGISTMKAGGRRRVVVPPELGPPTGPSTFFSAKQYEVFDIELLSIKNCERRQVLFYSDVVCD